MSIDTLELSSAERLLWSYGILEPGQIDLEAIASDKGARVVYRHMDGCEARLLASHDRAVISVGNSPYPARMRFSLAHELAHWMSDRNARSFLCTKDDVGPQNAEAKSVEAHANAYASQLILPDYLVKPWTSGKRANLDVARTLAGDFRASLTAAAIKLSKRSAWPSCVVCHDKNRLLWRQRNAHFSSDFYLLPELHHDTDAFAMAFGSKKGMSPPRTEPADRWMSGGGAFRLSVRSQSISLPDSSVLTMLALDG